MKKKLGILLIILFILEFSSFTILKLYPKNSDDVYFKRHNIYEDKILDNISLIENYYNSPNYSKKLGWDNSRLDPRLNYLNARSDKLNEKKKMKVITFGDSFTWGDGVEHDETWSHYLSNELDIYVANYGVGGYGPFQSYLKYKNLNADLKDTEVVILGMFEITIDRIRNNYLNFYFNSGFRLRPIPEENSTKLTYKELPDFTKSKDFKYDFINFIKENKHKDVWWQRRVEIKFPYSINLFKLFFIIFNDRFELSLIYNTSKNSWDNKITNKMLNDIIDNFVTISNNKGIKPYILFIPRIRYKLSSGYKYQNFKISLIEKKYNVIDFADFINTYDDKNNKNLILPDGHFSSKANILIGKFLAEKIKF